MEPTDWAYLAGILDGEGTFFLGFSITQSTPQPSFRPLIDITLNEKEAFLLEEFRKALNEDLNGENGEKLYYAKKVRAVALRFRKKATLRFIIKGILPYLRLKREQAKLLLESIDVMDRVKGPLARPQGDMLKLAEIRDRIHELSSGKAPNQKWTYDVIKNYIITGGYGTREREQARFEKYQKYGVPHRLKKGNIPWNKGLRYTREQLKDKDFLMKIVAKYQVSKASKEAK